MNDCNGDMLKLMLNKVYGKSLETEPKIITICGSMDFVNEMQEQEKVLTNSGYIVLMPIMGAEKEFFNPTEEELTIYRKAHIEKIKMSDGIFIINMRGYVGRHTASEIEEAARMGKRIYFLENDSEHK